MPPARGCALDEIRPEVIARARLVGIAVIGGSEHDRSAVDTIPAAAPLANPIETLFGPPERNAVFVQHQALRIAQLRADRLGLPRLALKVCVRRRQFDQRRSAGKAAPRRLGALAAEQE